MLLWFLLQEDAAEGDGDDEGKDGKTSVRYIIVVPFFSLIDGKWRILSRRTRYTKVVKFDRRESLEENLYKFAVTNAFEILEDFKNDIES